MDKIDRTSNSLAISALVLHIASEDWDNVESNVTTSLYESGYRKDDAEFLGKYINAKYQIFMRQQKLDIAQLINELVIKKD